MQTQKFKKLAHLFAHRRQGCQKRFEKVYLKVKDEVQTAWLADLSRMEQEFEGHFKSNQALAQTKLTREKQLAESTAKQVIKTVFDEWRAEVNRIVTELNGYPQNDGNILFPDGSTARMPKGLFITKEQQLQF